MSTPLDRIDLQILEELQKNARIQNKALARAVGVAESTCLERVRRLENAEVIRGSHADVDGRFLGANLQAAVHVKLARHTRKAVEAFQEAMLAVPQVLAVYHLAGSHDFMLHVAVPSPEHLRAFAMDGITSRPEVVHLETHLIFQYTRNPVHPQYLEAGIA